MTMAAPKHAEAPVDATQQTARGASAQDSAGPAPSQIGWLIVWMSGTLISFIISAVSVRAMSKTFNAFEMMSLRSAGGLVILGLLGAFQPSLWAGVRINRMRLQTFRNIAHFGSQICWTMAITMLPFATVFALEMTIPAWVTILAVIFLGERMFASRAAALALCVVGALVILRPGHEAFQPAALIMLLGALLFAIAAISTKKLITTETTFSIMLWMNLMQLPLNFAGSDPAFLVRFTPALILPTLGICAAGLAIHYCLANAFRCADAIMVIPMDFLRVPLIAVIGWAFYDENPDLYVFAGAGLIVIGVLWNVRGEAQRNGALAQASHPPAHGAQPQAVRR
jgi:drug/metabolite transporter (DMT)-like permease